MWAEPYSECYNSNLASAMCLHAIQKHLKLPGVEHFEVGELGTNNHNLTRIICTQKHLHSMDYNPWSQIHYSVSSNLARSVCLSTLHVPPSW